MRDFLPFSWHLRQNAKQCHYYWQPYQLASVQWYSNSFNAIAKKFFLVGQYFSFSMRVCFLSIPLFVVRQSHVWFQFKLIRIHFNGKRQIHHLWSSILSICRWRRFADERSGEKSREKKPFAIVWRACVLSYENSSWKEKCYVCMQYINIKCRWLTFGYIANCIRFKWSMSNNLPFFCL